MGDGRLILPAGRDGPELRHNADTEDTLERRSSQMRDKLQTLRLARQYTFGEMAFMHTVRSRRPLYVILLP